MRISDWSSDVCSSDLFKGHIGLPDTIPGIFPDSFGPRIIISRPHRLSVKITLTSPIIAVVKVVRLIVQGFIGKQIHIPGPAFVRVHDAVVHFLNKSLETDEVTDDRRSTRLNSSH